MVLCQDIGYQQIPQVIRMDFTQVLEKVRFAFVWQQHDASVEFFDSRGGRIGGLTIPGKNPGGGHWIEYGVDPQAPAIARMDIRVHDYSFIDNFSLWHQLNR